MINGGMYYIKRVDYNPLAPCEAIEVVVSDESGKTMNIGLYGRELAEILRALPHPSDKVMVIRYEKKRQKTSVKSGK